MLAPCSAQWTLWGHQDKDIFQELAFPNRLGAGKGEIAAWHRHRAQMTKDGPCVGKHAGLLPCIVSPDFSKAFGTVAHKILIGKLLKYGLDGQTEVD